MKQRTCNLMTIALTAALASACMNQPVSDQNPSAPTETSQAATPPPAPATAPAAATAPAPAPATPVVSSAQAAGTPTQPVTAPTQAAGTPTQPVATPATCTAAPADAKPAQGSRANPGFQAYVRKTKANKAQLSAQTSAQTQQTASPQSNAATDAQKKKADMATVRNVGLLLRKNPSLRLPKVAPTAKTPTAGAGTPSAPTNTPAALPPGFSQVNLDGSKVGHLCDREDVKAKLESTRAALDTCYQGLLNASPGLHGTVTVEWAIQNGGAVGGPRIHQNDSGSQKLAQCVVAVFKDLKFKPPKGNMCVVRWPVVFTPRNIK